MSNELRNAFVSAVVVALAFRLVFNGIINSFRLWLSINTLMVIRKKWRSL
jgi:hypothetical protein